MYNIIMAAIIMAAFFYIWLLIKLNKIKKELEKATADHIKLMFQKKQSEIVTGQVAEKLAPFLKNFKHSPQDIQFLGNPIDYIAFEDDGITIIEIKSANSRLTAKQKIIKEQIKNKKVFWEEFRIK